MEYLRGISYKGESGKKKSYKLKANRECEKEDRNTCLDALLIFAEILE